ncbi:MAG: sulfotransferase family 2 domain-containing protein [Flavobacteriales bacterium]|nr:sulfotransferase family 2 domain-containing protein [Flavobacteriales bacterium]
MIISMHTPKAGGSSFKQLLRKHYGLSLKGDYKDIPKSFEDRTKDAIKFDKRLSSLKILGYKMLGVKCIHGHFLPYKYKKLLDDESTIFITWLREPTERLISHYYYWQRTSDKRWTSLHKKVIEEGWSLEEFCLSEEMRNIYGKYLWNFSVDNFDFIGVTEYFEEDVLFFARKYLGYSDSINIPIKNVNPNNTGLYSDKIDKELLIAIKDFHSKDYDLYNYALDKKKNRM